MQNHRVTNNAAIRSLMDDSLMVGRHRPVVAKWFQDWAEDIGVVVVIPSVELEAANDPTELKDYVKKKLAHQIAESFLSEIQFIESPPSKSMPDGIEIRASIQIFRSTSRSAPQKSGAV